MEHRKFVSDLNSISLKSSLADLFFVRIFFILNFTCCYLISCAQSVIIQDAPAWIEKQIPDLSAVSKEGKSGGHYYLLLDRQENVANKTSFTHNVYKILTNEGIQEMSDLSVDFDPSYQQLTFHYILIHRSGKMLNKLPAQGIKTIQREQSMERYLYDGSLTAIINLEDVRVNDVIEYAYSLKGYNPILNGHFSRRIYFDYYISFEKLFRRLLLPAGINIQEKYFNGEVTPQKRNVGGMTEYVWRMEKVDALILDNGTPSWYEAERYMILSDFANWPDVAAWAYNHFSVDEREKEKLKTEVNHHIPFTDQDQFMAEAIRFVQDEVRYLGFESGRNSHKPHTPRKVFQQRFGDCKDKSLLLSSLLQLHGIEAYPMLVNTSAKDHLSEELPSYNAFDHCVVQVIHNQKTFFIDPTINNQGGPSLKHYFPAYGKGLVVKKESVGLIDLPAPGISEIIEEDNIKVTTVGGDALLIIKTEYRGHEADGQRSYFAGNSMESIQKGYINYYGNLYPDIQAEKNIETKDDRENNIFIVHEEYTIPKFWKNDAEVKSKIYCELYSLSLETYFNVSKSVQRKSPYHLTYPVSYDHYIDVNLPEEWEITEETDHIETEYYSYSFDRSLNGRKVSIHHQYKTLSDHIPLKAMDKFIRDHETMKSNLTYYLTYEEEKESTSNNTNYYIFLILLVAVGLIWKFNRR